jgi:hypothetical protein
MREVASDDAGVVCAVPGGRRRGADEVEPELDAPRRRPAAWRVGKEVGFDLVAEKRVADRAPPGTPPAVGGRGGRPRPARSGSAGSSARRGRSGRAPSGHPFRGRRPRRGGIGPRCCPAPSRSLPRPSARPGRPPCERIYRARRGKYPVRERSSRPPDAQRPEGHTRGRRGPKLSRWPGWPPTTPRLLVSSRTCGSSSEQLAVSFARSLARVAYSRFSTRWSRPASGCARPTRVRSTSSRTGSSTRPRARAVSR